MNTKVKFQKVDMRTPDPFGWMRMDFKRLSIHKDKFVLTIVKYNKCLYRGVIQRVLDKAEGNYRFVQADEAWQSPVFATMQEAISSSVGFAGTIWR